MRGGSRWGAGRPGWKGKVGSRYQLDIRAIVREGFLVPGQVCKVGWSSEGEQRASIGMFIESVNRITLRYKANAEDVCLPVRLTRTECSYGGTRVWFACPYCSRRTAILYSSGKTWACRQCTRLTYASQSENRVDRAWRKQRKIENKLSGGKGEWNQWQKPKGMHQTTFDRLRCKIIEIEEIKDQAFWQVVVRLMGKVSLSD